MKKRSLLCLLVAGVLSLSACTTSGTKTPEVEFMNEAVMTIDGQEIPKSMYMVYLYTTTQSFLSAGGEDIWTTDFDGKTADELVEERTLKTIQSVVAARKYAQENGIALTDEQKESVVKMAEEFIGAVPEADIAKMGVNLETLTTLMEDSYLYTLAYKKIAEEAEINEDEKNAYHEESYDSYKSDYTKVVLNSVVLDNADVAAEVATRAKAGEDFATLFDEYDVDDSAKETETKGEMSMYVSEFLSTFSFEAVPEVGTITDPIEVNGTFFVLKIEDTVLPTDEEIKDLADTAFTEDVKASYADSRVQELMDAQEVAYVEEEYAKVEKFHS